MIDVISLMRKKQMEIPNWIGSLSSLQDLSIAGSGRIKSLPDEMCQLTHLTRLILSFCSVELKERCKESSGDDWHKIKHIPLVAVRVK
ncbi:putative disease resistance protein RGA3 [Bienertia sinuspersici]